MALDQIAVEHYRIVSRCSWHWASFVIRKEGVPANKVMHPQPSQEKHVEFPPLSLKSVDFAFEVTQSRRT
jgi:hypothetical protein